MNITCSKIGGLIVTSANYDTTPHGFQFCIFPANKRWGRSKKVIILFGIGFSFNYTKR